MAKRGRPRGIPCLFKGMPRPESVRRKISEKAKLRFKDKAKHPSWRGGLPKCIDCGKELSCYDRKRCLKCYKIFDKKIRFPEYRVKKILYNCIFCKREFKRYSCETNNKQNIFCSRECFWKWEKQHPMPHLKNYAKICLGRKRSEEIRKNMSISRKKYIMEHGLSRCYKDTSLEKKIEEQLKINGINYIKQAFVCKGSGNVDFYLPNFKVVIECDGEYWHRPEINKGRDERKDFYLNFNGFKVYRFPEKYIKLDSLSCVNSIKEVVDG